MSKLTFRSWWIMFFPWQKLKPVAIWQSQSVASSIGNLAPKTFLDLVEFKLTYLCGHQGHESNREECRSHNIPYVYTNGCPLPRSWCNCLKYIVTVRRTNIIYAYLIIFGWSNSFITLTSSRAFLSSSLSFKNIFLTTLLLDKRKSCFIQFTKSYLLFHRSFFSFTR